MYNIIGQFKKHKMFKKYIENKLLLNMNQLHGVATDSLWSGDVVVACNVGVAVDADIDDTLSNLKRNDQVLLIVR